MDTELTFGRWLRRSRKAYDLTQAELAANLDVLETTLRDVPQRHRNARLLQHVVDTVAAPESSGKESEQRQGLVAYALTLQSFFFAGFGQFDKHVSCLERSHAAVQQYGTPYEIATHC